MSAEDVPQDRLNLLDIIRIGNTNREIHSPGALGGYIRDDGRPDHIIRHDHALIVERHESRIDQAHVTDFATDASCFNDISDIKWPIHQDHKSGREIGERVLQCKADDESDNAEPREQWAKGNSQL